MEPVTPHNKLTSSVSQKSLADPERFKIIFHKSVRPRSQIECDLERCENGKEGNEKVVHRES